jgi:hypothetical protein
MTPDAMEEIKATFEELEYNWVGYASIEALEEAIEALCSNLGDVYEALDNLKLTKSTASIDQYGCELGRLVAEKKGIEYKLELLEEYLAEEEAKEEFDEAYKQGLCDVVDHIWSEKVRTSGGASR